MNLLKGLSASLNNRICDFDAWHTSRICGAGIAVRDILTLFSMTTLGFIWSTHGHELETKLTSIEQLK